MALQSRHTTINLLCYNVHGGAVEDVLRTAELQEDPCGPRTWDLLGTVSFGDVGSR